MYIQVLQDEMKRAMKEHDKARKDAISMLIAQIKQEAIDSGNRDNISDEMAANVLLRAKKRQNEMISTCPSTRQDLLEKYCFELSVIDEFAPKLIDSPRLINEIIKTIGLFPTDENKGKIMKELKRKGVDMKVAARVVQERIKNERNGEITFFTE